MNVIRQRLIMNKTRKRYLLLTMAFEALFLVFAFVEALLLIRGFSFLSPLSLSMFFVSISFLILGAIFTYFTMTSGFFNVSSLVFTSKNKVSVDGYGYRVLEWKIVDVKEDDDCFIVSHSGRLHFRIEKSKLDQETISKLREFIGKK